MKTDSTDGMISAIAELEVELKKRMREYHFLKNAFSIANVITAEDNIRLKLIFVDLLKYCISIQRKTEDLVKYYKRDLEIVDRKIESLQIRKERCNDGTHCRMKLQKKNKKSRRVRDIFLIRDEETFSHSNGARSSYFRSEYERCEHKNEDLLDIHRSGYSFISRLQVPRVWVRGDRDRLLTAIRAEIKLGYLNELKQVDNAMRVSKEDEKLHLVQRACKLTEYLRESDEKSIRNLLRVECSKEFDWNSISRNYFKNRRSSAELECMWNLIANPEIENKKWTLAEDILLRRLAIDSGFQNWESINELMPKPRSGFVCFSRYTSVFKRKLVIEKWSSRFERETLNGRKLGRTIPTALSTPADTCRKSQTPQSVVYSNSTKVEKKGSFSKREKLVANNYLKRGFSYKAVANIMGTRSENQIRDHFHASIERATVKKWTESEDRALLTGIRFLGEGNWSAISRYMDKRTADQCRSRYKQLMTNRESYVKRYLNRRSPNTTKLWKHIQKFLSRKRLIMTRRSLDKKLELHYLFQLDARVRIRNEYALAEHGLKLLKFLSFDVSCSPEQATNFSSWLMNYPSSTSEIEWIRDKCFANKFRTLKTEMKTLPMKTVPNIFSHIVCKFCRVLPPSKCTLYGLGKFMENYEDFIAKNGEIDFETAWNLQNNKQKLRKNFNESKIFWYRVLKAVFFWPLKLKTVLLEDLL